MLRKCCAYACRTNYDRKTNNTEDPGKKLSVNRLPTDTEERRKWMKAVPNANLTVNSNIVLCELHWPKKFETIKVRGRKLRPKNPPSVWPRVPTSQIPTPLASERTTKRTSSAVRNSKDDELNLFLLKDAVLFSVLKHELIIQRKKLPQSIFAVALDNETALLDDV